MMGGPTSVISIASLVVAYGVAAVPGLAELSLREAEEFVENLARQAGGHGHVELLERVSALYLRRWPEGRLAAKAFTTALTLRARREPKTHDAARAELERRFGPGSAWAAARRAEGATDEELALEPADTGWFEAGAGDAATAVATYATKELADRCLHGLARRDVRLRFEGVRAGAPRVVEASALADDERACFEFFAPAALAGVPSDLEVELAVTPPR